MEHTAWGLLGIAVGLIMLASWIQYIRRKKAHPAEIVLTLLATAAVIWLTLLRKI